MMGMGGKRGKKNAGGESEGELAVIRGLHEGDRFGVSAPAGRRPTAEIQYSFADIR